MTYVKLDTGFFTHPKAVAAGRDGRALYIAALCWSKDKKTDGHIPDVMVDTLAHQAAVKSAVADLLLEVGLWQRNGSGFVINDFLDWNLSREQIDAESKRKAIAGREGARRRWQKDGSVPSESDG